MKPYAVRMGYIPTPKVILFEKMVEDVKALRDIEPAESVSCHALCRALALNYDDVTCVDGFFSVVGHDHSWLDFGEGIIADIYPIAASGSLLIDTSHWMVPWSRLYIPKPELLDTGNRNRKTHEAMAMTLFDMMRK